MQSAHYYSTHQDCFLLKMAAKTASHSSVMSNHNQVAYLKSFFEQLRAKYPRISGRGSVM